MHQRSHLSKLYGSSILTKHSSTIDDGHDRSSNIFNKIGYHKHESMTKHDLRMHQNILI